MTVRIDIADLHAMETFAHTVAENIFPGFLIGLDGDLGAGKTTFTQFLGAALGIREVINSPTFTIIKHYETETIPFVHIDAYRLEGVGYDAEIEEESDTRGVCVVEWAQYVEDSLPETYLSIRIEHAGGERRTLFVQGRGRYEAIARSLGA